MPFTGCMRSNFWRNGESASAAKKKPIKYPDVARNSPAVHPEKMGTPIAPKVRYAAIAISARRAGKASASATTTNVCKVIGTGVHGSGIRISLAVMSAITPNVIQKISCASDLVCDVATDVCVFVMSSRVTQHFAHRKRKKVSKSLSSVMKKYAMWLEKS